MTNPPPKYIFQEDLLKACTLIRDVMQKEFLGQFMTEATKERARRRLADLMQRQRQTERNPIWDLEFQLVFGVGSLELRPIIPDGTELISRNPLTKYQ
jgi:hypothetical protein